jgi:hypothetical protein
LPDQQCGGALILILLGTTVAWMISVDDVISV